MTAKARFYRPGFVQNPIFRYLNDTDRYIAAPVTPSYRFNVIGTGINGQEHIRVTLMEGRATIHGIFDPNKRSVKAAKREAKRYDDDIKLKVYDSRSEERRVGKECRSRWSP